MAGKRARGALDRPHASSFSYQYNSDLCEMSLSVMNCGSSLLHAWLSCTALTQPFVIFIERSSVHQRTNIGTALHHQYIPWSWRRFVLKMQYLHISTCRDRIIFAMFARSSDAICIGGANRIRCVRTSWYVLRIRSQFMLCGQYVLIIGSQYLFQKIKNQWATMRVEVLIYKASTATCAHFNGSSTRYCL